MEEADILCVKFRHVRIVDNESLDDQGFVVACMHARGFAAFSMEAR